MNTYQYKWEIGLATRDSEDLKWEFDLLSDVFVTLNKEKRDHEADAIIWNRDLIRNELKERQGKDLTVS